MMTWWQMAEALNQAGVEVRNCSFSGSWTIYTWMSENDLKKRLEDAGFHNIQTWVSTDDIDTLGMTVAMFEERTMTTHDASGITGGQVQ